MTAHTDFDFDAILLYRQHFEINGWMDHQKHNVSTCSAFAWPGDIIDIKNAIVKNDKDTLDWYPWCGIAREVRDQSHSRRELAIESAADHSLGEDITDIVIAYALD